jgi:hypothetical protein
MRYDKYVIPDVTELRGEVIKSHHDSLTAGHPGINCTQELIYCNYWWPLIKRDVCTYVSGCQVCQKVKTDRQAGHNPLQPNPVASRNWEVISVDMIMHLPESQGKNTILMIVDTKSKTYISIPCTDKLSSEGWAELLLKNVITIHGLPHLIISDCSSIFVSSFIKSLYCRLGISSNPSTAYHPQTDGQTEHLNQELETYFHIFINHCQSDWVEYLHLANFSYSTQKHSSTGYSPFFMTHGHDPSTGVEPVKETNNKSAEQFATRMKEIQDEASAALLISQTRMKEQYNKHTLPSQLYQVGDLVMLSTMNITTVRQTKKLDDKRVGPFKILEKIGRSMYKLKLPSTWKSIHPVFNEVLLRPYIPANFPGQLQQSRPLPNIPVNLILPSKILDSRVHCGALQYLIQWHNKPLHEATWELHSKLTRYPQLLHKFHEQNPQAPRMPTITIAPRACTLQLELVNWKEWEHYDTIWERWQQRCLKNGLSQKLAPVMADEIFTCSLIHD